MPPTEVILYFGAYCLAHAGIAIGAYINIKVSIAELRVMVNSLSKDIDRLGSVLGTERSKGDLK